MTFMAVYFLVAIHKKNRPTIPKQPLTSFMKESDEKLTVKEKERERERDEKRWKEQSQNQWQGN